MEMIKAMRQCKPGGFISRRAYPSRKFFKNYDCIFPDALPPLINRIDFMASDWDPHDGANIDMRHNRGMQK